MNIAQRAGKECQLASCKQRLEDAIIREAKRGQRSLQLPTLYCQSEDVPFIKEWLQSEGLKVQYVEQQEKPTGLGSMLAEDDDTVTVSYFTIWW